MAIYPKYNMFTSIQIYFPWNIPASKSVKAAAQKKNSTAPHPSNLCTGQCAALWSTTSQGIGFIVLAASAVSLSHQPTFFSYTKKPSLLKVQPKNPAELFSSQRFFFLNFRFLRLQRFFVKYLEERTNLRSIRFKETALQRESKSTTTLHQHVFLASIF